MDWQAIDFDWNQARAVLATIEEGSLSAAARALGQSQPTLGRQVAAFEAKLGIVIFERFGRGLTVTPAGQELATHLTSMRDAALRVSLAATGQAQTVEGMVKISVSDLFATTFMPAIVRDLRQRAPRLITEVVADNAISDLQRREADIAIRHVRPEQPELMAKLLGNARASFYAHTSYLKDRGTPNKPNDFKDMHFVGLGDVPRMLGYFTDLGLPLTAANFSTRTDSGNVSWEMAKAGLGIIAMADFIAKDEPGMVRLGQDLPPITFPFWLTTHRELHTSARIRFVFDHLAAALRRYVT